MNPSSITLLIDTASPYLIIGLYRGNTTLQAVYQKGNNDHSVTLMDNIERMFTTQGFGVRDLGKIIVGIGPGSYTGVRIGVSVAKIFAWSHKIPLFTVSSLALKASGENEEGKVLSIIEARRNHGFVGVYEIKGGGLYLNERDHYRDLEGMHNELPHDIEATTKPPRIDVLLQGDVLKEAKNVHTVQPNYLRKTEAQRNKDKAQ